MDLRERRAQQHRHPWEAARAGFFRRLVRNHAERTPATVVDVGAGDGWFATQLRTDLEASASIVCWDAHYTADDLGAALPSGISRTTLPPSLEVDLVLALDVLEHVLDDHAFVAEQVKPLVARNGMLVVSVPAHPRLFTSHDTALGHHRRHTMRSLMALLEPHFQVVERGSLFTSLLLPRAVAAVIERIIPPKGVPAADSEWRHGRVLTAVVTAALAADGWLGQWCARLRIPLPGLSVWAVCRPKEHT